MQKLTYKDFLDIALENTEWISKRIDGYTDFKDFPEEKCKKILLLARENKFDKILWDDMKTTLKSINEAKNETEKTIEEDFRNKPEYLDKDYGKLTTARDRTYAIKNMLETLHKTLKITDSIAFRQRYALEKIEQEKRNKAQQQARKAYQNKTLKEFTNKAIDNAKQIKENSTTPTKIELKNEALKDFAENKMSLQDAYQKAKEFTIKKLNQEEFFKNDKTIQEIDNQTAYNGFTGQTYTGLNALMIQLDIEENQYKNPVYLTKTQAKMINPQARLKPDIYNGIPIKIKNNKFNTKVMLTEVYHVSNFSNIQLNKLKPRNFDLLKESRIIARNNPNNIKFKDLIELNLPPQTANRLLNYLMAQTLGQDYKVEKTQTKENKLLGDTLVKENEKLETKKQAIYHKISHNSISR